MSELSLIPEVGKDMTTVAILPISDINGERIYEAIAGDKRSIGKTVGEALDGLTVQLENEEFSALLVIQSFSPDNLFGAKQQERLSELMNLWRTARDSGQSLSPAQQIELDRLVEAELKAATARSEGILQQVIE
ncbi:hypothetical protein ACKFKF_18575 [Phormidesmis sp. 146-12]